MKKKLVALVTMLAFVACVALTGCGGSSSDAGSAAASTAGDGTTYTMQIGHAVSEEHPSHTTLLDFKAAVEEATNGGVVVEISPNGALGGDAQTTEMITLDSLQGTVVGADAVSGLVNEFGLVGAPYLFESRDAAWAALDGEFGAALADLAASQNIVVAGWGDAGFRMISNNAKEIVTPDDLKGLKIRTMENDLHMDLFKLFGANPTPIAFNELFTALQQGTVDAQENPWTAFTTSKFYEVQKYMTVTNHVYTAAPFLINKSWLESLPEDYQTAILDAAAEWTTAQRQAILDSEAGYRTECEDNGMEIRELSEDEMSVWVDKAAELDDKIVEKYGQELFDLAKSFN